MISVDTSTVHEALPRFLAKEESVVFHPLEQSCFFVIFEARPERLTSTTLPPSAYHRLVVQEFIEGKPTMIKTLDLNVLTSSTLQLTGLLHDGIVGLCKAFLAQPSTAVESNKSEPQIHSRSVQTGTDDNHPNPFTMVAFDIYQKKFLLQDYCLSANSQGVSYWRDQIFYAVCGDPTNHDEHEIVGK